MKTKDVKKQLLKKHKREKLTNSSFLSTGSTLLNLALTGKPNCGFVKGKYHFIVGDSISGKTFLSLTCLAEAATMPEGKARYDVLRQAEEIAFSEDMAVMPFYYYSRSNWIDTDVWGGWHITILDVHPWKGMFKK